MCADAALSCKRNRTDDLQDQSEVLYQYALSIIPADADGPVLRDGPQQVEELTDGVIALAYSALQRALRDAETAVRAGAAAAARDVVARLLCHRHERHHRRRDGPGCRPEAAQTGRQGRRGDRGAAGSSFAGPTGGGEGRGGSTQAVPRRGCATAAVGCTTSAASLAPAYPCPRARTAGATTTVRRSSNTSQDLRTANANRRAEPGAATIRDGSRACHDGQASRQAGRAGAAGILAGA